jgi:RND superfamily putative drug exporter
MFRSLGRAVTKFWAPLLVGWLGLFAALKLTAPDWNQVATDGELQHLPPDMPTRVGDDLYARAFPDDIAGSSIVLVLHRHDRELLAGDTTFVSDDLVPGLTGIAEQSGGLIREGSLLDVIPHEIREIAEAISSHGVDAPILDELSKRRLARPQRSEAAGAGPTPRIVSIGSFRSWLVGPMLLSTDGRATVVLVELTSGFLETRNRTIIDQVESLIQRLHREGKVPEGLQISLTGSATVGGDAIQAVSQSSRAVRRWAIWIAVALLIVVFRAPVAALIPLATMYVAVEIALAALAWAAFGNVLEVFDGLELYVTVIVYGAGVDYSLFLISRHQEELRKGDTVSNATTLAVLFTGTVIAASAGTEIVGIGLLSFAEFGKFEQAGVGIALGLTVLLAASLTFTPSLLRLAGRWAFWPQPVGRRRRAVGERVSGLLSLDRMSQRTWMFLGEIQRKRPLVTLLLILGVLAPLAIVGLANINHLTYGLAAELPAEFPGVRGTEVLCEHFHPGMTGPITLLIRDDRFDFSSHEGIRHVATLTERLRSRADRLGVADVRSLADPLGHSPRAREIIADLAAKIPVAPFLGQGEVVVCDAANLDPLALVVQEAVRELAYEQYVSSVWPYDGRVTRLTLIPQTDPFRLDSIDKLDAIEETIERVMPEALSDSSVYLLGVTAGLRDVRDIAQSDRTRIMAVVPVAVLLVLMLLLRRVIVCVYLMLTVLFSFFVTLGATVGLFWALDPQGFQGVEWTVPIFLFALLVAVGQDYNVMLVSRADEERRQHGPTRGVTEALAKTGGLISGAGLIMAGTFSALAIGGTMTGMRQLGFALSFGVLLDTFVVRPFLVPSFLNLKTGRWLSRRRRAEPRVDWGSGLVRSCHCCGLVQWVPIAPRQSRICCRRCGTELKSHPSGRRANSLSAAIALAALILYVPAITLPFLRIEQLGHSHANSLIGGVVSLLAQGEWFVGSIILAFSVVLPPAKLLALLLLSTPARLGARGRVRATRAVEQIGRWGMLDVLLVAVLVAFVKLGDLVEFYAGPGLFTFGALVLLSLLATYFFDPHALWDEGPMLENSDSDRVRANEDASPREPRDANKNSHSPDNPPHSQPAGAAEETEQGSAPRGDRGVAEESIEDDLLERNVRVPKASVVPRRRLSWWWLLPLAVLVGVGVMAYQSWRESGTRIYITFGEGHGLKAGDQLRYRGTVVGAVEQVELDDDLDAVQVRVRLKPSAAGLAREGTRFWVVRPEVGLTEITGLETVVGAKYLTVLPGPADTPPQYRFIGLEEAPPADMRETGGIQVVLQTPDASGLSAGSPLYYRRLRVGAVHEIALARDGSAVEVRAYVRPGFRHLVRANTKWWKCLGMRLEGGLTGFSVEFDAVETLLQPGVAMAVPPEPGDVVDEGYRFILHDEPEDEWLQWKPSLGAGTVPHRLPHPLRAILEWTNPGYLYDTTAHRNGWVVPVDGTLIGPSDLISEPPGAEQDSARLLLTGWRIDIPDQVDPAGVGIARIGAHLPGARARSVALREADVPEDVLVVADRARDPVLVAAARLTQDADQWRVDPEVPLDPTWHGAAAVSVRDGALVGLLLLDKDQPRIGLYRRPDQKPAGSASQPQPKSQESG